MTSYQELVSAPVDAADDHKRTKLHTSTRGTTNDERIAPGVPAISVQGVTHHFQRRGAEPTLAIDHVSLDIAERQFIAIVGPSGCGKTTLLNLVAGLTPLQEGVIEVRGTSVAKPRRDVGYISARDSLLPWRTAEANVAYGLEVRGVRKAERLEKARHFLEMVGLSGFESSYRSQLSQGMRQRVAIARTLATEPELLLLDEPFSALDQQTKLLLENAFIEIWQKSQRTVVMVTHDIEEAVAMADRVVMLSHRPGQVIADIEVDLPRPRDAAEIRYDSRFREITHGVWELLRKEIAQLDIAQI
ncbi:ABC transporter ATP-binding protein [Rhodococcus sp. OK302]|uniref:ABC transporter ATP-binding protein n=1 Tax=Rhodococcus sp. OK302 TaxID=1882769 RepID=UPI000B9F357C|nr:ABC transporter ATP-binding protein [Rhodococcus sp. OK302]OYD69901.1 NitT/TauT family transport system ATP-binding protein [Rhodococcus sp. OK302]